MPTENVAVSSLNDKEYRKRVNSWALYDWATSAFAATIMAAILPIFYESEAKGTVSGLGYTNSISMLLIAFAAPVLGAIADHSRARKRFLGAFASAGILVTALMVFLRSGDWLLASVLYVVGRIGFGGANIFYDSLLPHVARADDMDQVSLRGYALGYMGGGLLLALNVLIILRLDLPLGARLSFLSVAVWWALFSIPLFRNVPEPHAVVTKDESRNPIRAGFTRLRATLREIRRYRQLTKFLAAFWLYDDAIGTIIVMAAIFAKSMLKEAGANPDVHIVGAILMAQFVGVPFAILFAWLARHLGTKRSILLGLSLYTLICIGGSRITTPLHFWLLAFAVAMVQGGCQALTRSLFGAMSPKAKVAEFFGFYNVSAKFGGIVGPLVCGLVYDLSHSSQLCILTLVPFFVGGALLLNLVDEKEGMRAAREEDEALLARASAR